MTTFAAKVDLWFLLLFYGLGVGMTVAAPLLMRRFAESPNSGSRDKWAAGLLFGIGLLFVGVGWRASAVHYVLTDDGYLDATGWPLDGRIAHVTEIESVEPSSDPRASHAASLDRLRVAYRDGRSIFIAVHDELGFLDALAAMDPELERSQSGIRRR